MIRSQFVRPLDGASARFETWTLIVVYAVLLLAASAPIVLDPVPPLADYVNHLARMHVIAAIDHSPLLQRFYEIHWDVIPNLVMDIVVPVLNRYVDIYVAGQLFLLATVVLLVTGPMAVHRVVHGRLSVWPLIAFPLVYNGIFLYGFANYLFGLGLAMWGIAVWMALRDRPAWQRITASTAIVLALFACHLYAVGVYGLAVLSAEIVTLARRRPTGAALLGELAALAVPFIPVIPLMLASPTLGLSGETWWLPTGKIDGLRYVVETYSDMADFAVVGILAAAVIWGARHHNLKLHPVGFVVLILGTIVYLAMPRLLLGSWMADQRLPIAIVFLLIGFVRFDAGERSARFAFLAMVAGALVVRLADVQIHWDELRRVDAEFRASAQSIAPGSVVLVGHADDPEGGEAFNAGISHAPCVALIERDSLVSTAFSVPGKQILSVRPDFRDRVDTLDGDPPRVSQLLASVDGSVPGQEHYWDGWPQRYDYLYVLYTNGEPNPDPDHLDLLFSGRRFQLYAVRGGQ